MDELTAKIPSSTYRLQFHAGFTFRNALDILDYLDDLGVGDVYSSPFFQAPPESTHGYDIANHNRLNPTMGDASDFQAFISGIRERNFGHLLDFVPNHMGISQSINTWWMAVLEEGTDSPYANYFDIDWHPGKAELANKVLLPILGELYGKVLESGDFKLSYEDGNFFLHYFETLLPINPRSYSLILQRALSRLNDAEATKLQPITETFASSAPRGEDKKVLAELMGANPAVREAIDQTLRLLEGEAGKPESFDSLHTLLEAQVYRLSHWRVAAEEINYRRFFDINTLAAIRVELPEVFEASHKLVFELLSRGDVTGLRIDHIDGLWNPRAYLRRLQERYAELAGGRELYLIVEKILDSTHEQLPPEWPVHGTTGYEFANQVARLFVDGSSEKTMTRSYEKFANVTGTFADLVYEKKKLIMQIALSSEITALGKMLDRLSEMHRHFRDFTRLVLTAAVRETIACFSVYRTYVTAEEPVSGEDEKIILRAIADAERRNPSIEKAVFDFLRNILLLRLPDHLSASERELHIRFAMKFQQCSGPVTAKGLEDTAFYIYNRLIALNEVGGDPGQFGADPAELHRLNAERLEHFPHSLLATSTHDTKRSEDVRMRLVALSEFPEEWRRAHRKWSSLNKKHRSEVDGREAPSPNEEYLLYQTLLGSWPLHREELAAYVERVQNYMLKAVKEAKLNSKWTEPNQGWEKALSGFVSNILDETKSAAFLADFSRLARKLAPLGALNSLAQTVLKCTVPGVPDFYQGSEIWDLSLVDPDNRRPVDYGIRRQLLETVSSARPADLVKDWKSGAVKLFVIRKLLHLRRMNREFFLHADYCPLEIRGTWRDHVFAFRRSWRNQQLLVVVPRLASPLGDFPMGGVWKDTSVDLETPGSWINEFTGATVPLHAQALAVSHLLSEFPVGVYGEGLQEPLG